MEHTQTETLPKVAVCLAAFNGIRWISEQVDSILKQSYVQVTLFISVDQSSDGTEKWVDQRALEDKRIVVLSHGQRFGGAARNFFRLVRDVDFSAFDYMGFADQDDIWFEDKLARAIDLLGDSGAEGYSSNVIAFWSDGRKALIRKSQPQRKWDFLFEAAGPGCTYVMRTAFVQVLKARINERWCDIQEVGLHDWFAYAFARANGYRWIIDDRPGMLYRQHGGNQFGANAGWRAFLHRACKVWNGWGMGQAALIAQLVGLQSNPFVRLWSSGTRLGYLRLACHTWQCRRRFRDRILFVAGCITLCFTRSHH